MKEIVEIDDSNFERFVTTSELPVVVKFYSNSCSPCLAMEPAFIDASNMFFQKANFYKFNVDKNSSIPSKLRILGIPTIIIFKGGKEMERVIGFQSLTSIIEFLRKNL